MNVKKILKIGKIQALLMQKLNRTILAYFSLGLIMDQNFLQIYKMCINCCTLFHRMYSTSIKTSTRWNINFVTNKFNVI